MFHKHRQFSDNFVGHGKFLQRLCAYAALFRQRVQYTQKLSALSQVNRLLRTRKACGSHKRLVNVCVPQRLLLWMCVCIIAALLHSKWSQPISKADNKHTCLAGIVHVATTIKNLSRLEKVISWNSKSFSSLPIKQWSRKGIIHDELEKKYHRKAPRKWQVATRQCLPENEKIKICISYQNNRITCSQHCNNYGHNNLVNNTSKMWQTFSREEQKRRVTKDVMLWHLPSAVITHNSRISF